MIQKFLTKYGLAAHVLCVCAFPVFFIARPVSDGMLPLLWLSLLVFEFMFMLPSVRGGETLADARCRVLRKLLWDPLFYVGAAVILLAAAQWLNSGCGLVYLTDADVWQMSKPGVSWLPFSVEPTAALSRLSVFVSCWAVALALRDAMSKASKRLLLQIMSLVSGCFAIYAVTLACLKSEPFAGMACGEGMSALGAFCGFWLLVAMGVFADALERARRSAGALFVFGVAGNLAGMLFFANVLTAVVYAALTVILVFYWLIYLAPHVPQHTRLKLFMASLLMFAAAVLSLAYLWPDNPLTHKINTALPIDAHLTDLMATKNVRSQAAVRIWEDYPWTGVGADGFRHFVGLVINPKDWGLIMDNKPYVYNDWLQALCEYGVLGSGLLLAAAVMMAVPVGYRARIAMLFGTGDENDGRVYLLRISPVVFCGVLALLMCLLESFISNPLRAPGCLLSWTCVTASLSAFLPAQGRAAGKT
ncbi:MAG: O-antigen ligase family protein [Kiritimatiellae bacterium]|nr:O-antigen ligase family protein [Kiritimatiellia bacterium]